MDCTTHLYPLPRNPDAPWSPFQTGNRLIPPRDHHVHIPVPYWTYTRSIPSIPPPIHPTSPTPPSTLTCSARFCCSNQSACPILRTRCTTTYEIDQHPRLHIRTTFWPLALVAHIISPFLRHLAAAEQPDSDDSSSSSGWGMAEAETTVAERRSARMVVNFMVAVVLKVEVFRG